MRVKPDDPELLRDLALVLVIAPDPALRDPARAVELAPDVDKYHYRLGLIYDGQGEHGKAVEAFKKASEAEEAEF